VVEREAMDEIYERLKKAERNEHDMSMRG